MSSVHTFTIVALDVIPHEIDTVIATPSSTETGGYVNITCDVSDSGGVDTVMVNISDPLGGTVNNGRPSGRESGNDTYNEVGTYSYFIWANDTKDNRNR